NIRQWIVDLIGLTQWDNVAMLVHGVSLSLRFWQARHPPRYAAYLIPSSPSFPHSSPSTPLDLKSPSTPTPADHSSAVETLASLRNHHPATKLP
ncbi:hypothetical protein, partial [Bradyrhizobium liaoningense]|uniref:hypothetical protein n=1 Tax=Bradyrhizobium liaoningense TaxID=43992 RepID=UPI0024E044B8